MYYKPTSGTLFPEHKHGIVINIADQSSSIEYYPSDVEGVYNSLKSPNSMVEVEPYTMVNTRHVKTVELITSIKVGKNWIIIDENILKHILSYEGQKDLLKITMKV